MAKLLVIEYKNPVLGITIEIKQEIDSDESAKKFMEYLTKNKHDCLDYYLPENFQFHFPNYEALINLELLNVRLIDLAPTTDVIQ